MKRIMKAISRFPERHPNFPLWLSIVALAASIVMPILRGFLERMI